MLNDGEQQEEFQTGRSSFAATQVSLFLSSLGKTTKERGREN